MNAKLKNKGVQIIGAFFRSREQSDKYVALITACWVYDWVFFCVFIFRTTCVNSLSGLILQLNFAVFDSRYCRGQTKEKCKVQFQQELTAGQLNVEFDQGSSKTINIKLCRLIDMTGTRIPRKFYSYRYMKIFFLL